MCVHPLYGKTSRDCLDNEIFFAVQVAVLCYMLGVMAESSVMSRDDTAGVLYLLEALGLTVNYKKGVTEPTQELEYLGVALNTTSMELKLPGEKLKKDSPRSGEDSSRGGALDSSNFITSNWQDECGISGCVTSTTHLQRALTKALDWGNQSYEMQLTLSEECKEELHVDNGDEQVEWEDVHQIR